MKKAPFNLEAALRGAKLVTRDGSIGTVEKYDYADTSGFPLCVFIAEECRWFTSTGKSSEGENFDLFLLIEEPAEGELVLPDFLSVVDTYQTDESIVFVEKERTNRDLILKAVMSARGMAEEIKRLRVERQNTLKLSPVNLRKRTIKLFRLTVKSAQRSTW